MSKEKLHIIFEETFQISLVGYLILLMTEIVKEGFVSNFFDLNILLGVILISGIGMVILDDASKKEATSKKQKSFYWGIIFSIMTACIIYYKIQNLGTFSIIISVASFFIVLLFSYLIQNDESTSLR